MDEWPDHSNAPAPTRASARMALQATSAKRTGTSAGQGRAFTLALASMKSDGIDAFVDLDSQVHRFTVRCWNNK